MNDQTAKPLPEIADIHLQIVAGEASLLIGFGASYPVIEMLPGDAIDMANHILKAARKLNRRLN